MRALRMEVPCSDPAQANHAFHSSWIGELVKDLHGKDRILACSSVGHRKLFIRSNMESNCMYDI